MSRSTVSDVSAWRETAVMRRDYVDWLGDYIPRGQPHFKLWPLRSGGLRLSVRSMHTVREAAEDGQHLAIAILRGEITDLARPALRR